MSQRARSKMGRKPECMTKLQHENLILPNYSRAVYRWQATKRTAVQMDPLSILSTVLSTSIAVSHWIDDLKSQETAILELKSSLSSITLVLHPLREKAASGTLDSQAGILACLQDLGECLDCARDHLQTWQESETRKTLGFLARRILAFLDPSQVLAMIKDDRVRINQSVATLTLAIQLAWLPGLPATAPVSPLDSIQNQEVKQFWRQMIGESGAYSFRCPLTVFRAALGRWLGGNIPDVLIFQLDEQGFGVVTPSGFSRFVGSQSVSQAISQSIPSVVSTPQADRLIVWIAEHLEKYASSIQYAESLGIKVVSFPSLAGVKSWMELNEVTACASCLTLRAMRAGCSTPRRASCFCGTSVGARLRRPVSYSAPPSPRRRMWRRIHVQDRLPTSGLSGDISKHWQMV
ncbi:hypothetical protein B0H11DRAFT_1373305 [Mycena galericulata]|nr:hypothetical protein B0H11DRAFT_1373305 [Mycena galericulata]